VLGNGAENAFRQSMLLSDGSMGIFFANGIVGTIMSLAIFMALLPIATWAYGKFAPGKAAPKSAAAN
jgi:TctA family transporter